MRYLTTIEPFAAFDRLWNTLDRPLPTQGTGAGLARSVAFEPVVDVVESAEAYSIEVELPGVAPDAVEVTLLDDVLTVTGEKPERPELAEGERAWARERRAGRFERRFRFPVAVDGSSVEAHAEHGVLHLRVAKAPEAKPVKISVKS